MRTFRETRTDVYSKMGQHLSGGGHLRQGDGGLFRYVAGEALVDKIVQAVPITSIQTLSARKREVGAMIVVLGAAAGAGATGHAALDRAIPRRRGTRGCG